ncbi:hypothetical protein HPB50_013769 [Hyalomma asiaticum]|uniref:Uncharacterized protein n=1 Tax=Hyalomma asiaticum TaxID=266040 RepID=A0ACB7S0L1_HYAAI|nr:hypothetical protein HPB50_013769 [Hyalomma asiaticum]
MAHGFRVRHCLNPDQPTSTSRQGEVVAVAEQPRCENSDAATDDGFRREWSREAAAVDAPNMERVALLGRNLEGREDESWSSSSLRSRPSLDTRLSPGRRPPHDCNLDNPGLGWFPRRLGIAAAPWELQPRPAIGDPPAAAPEPFRGNILTERYPSEPLAT